MAKRKALSKGRGTVVGLPVPPNMPKRSKHQKMLDQMHDALYNLGSQVNPPTLSNPETNGNELLPPTLQKQQPAVQSAAKQHVVALHKAFLDTVMSGKGGKSGTQES